MSQLMSIENLMPSTECTIVAQDFLLTLKETAEHDGFDYDLAEIRFGYLGEELVFRHMDNGSVSWSNGDLDADRMLVTVAGALPDGFAEMAVVISEKACFLADGTGADEVCDALGVTQVQLVELIRKAQDMSDSHHRAASECVGVTDCDGRLVRIGDWIHADGGIPRKVVGVGITELAGRVVMIDDPIAGSWVKVTDGVRIVSPNATNWEEFVELASRGVLSKESLIRMARELAGERG